jgi:acylphosphatase
MRETVRCRAIVSGRVQGVFFRDTCERVATGLGVRGWVRNRADGSVEVVAEGSRDAVSELLVWCRSGPPRARVDRVDITDEPVAGERGFLVRY